jgi:hypothetical protein
MKPPPRAFVAAAANSVKENAVKPGARQALVD